MDEASAVIEIELAAVDQVEQGAELGEQVLRLVLGSTALEVVAVIAPPR